VAQQVRRVRIVDVARAAGVSTAAVSYALRGSGRISGETRTRILRIAEELGFIRDDVAAQLRTGRSNRLGVILNNIVNPFFSELVAAFEAAAYREGYLTLLATAQNDPVRQAELIDAMIAQGVAGIVLSPVHGSAPEVLSAALERSVPIVVCVRDIPSSGAVFVGADERQSGYLAATHLVSRGHRSFVFLGGYADTTTWQLRRDGIRHALQEAGLPETACRNIPGTLRSDFAYVVLMDLGRTGDLPCTVLCFNDDLAGGAYRAAAELGRRVGTDFSVMGFDNIPQAATLQPPLSTVDIHPARIGQLSAEAIAAMLGAGERHHPPVVIRPELVARGSVAQHA
jgi:LacI family transcriptional regulator